MLLFEGCPKLLFTTTQHTHTHNTEPDCGFPTNEMMKMKSESQGVRHRGKGSSLGKCKSHGKGSDNDHSQKKSFPLYLSGHCMDPQVPLVSVLCPGFGDRPAHSRVVSHHVGNEGKMVATPVVRGGTLNSSQSS